MRKIICILFLLILSTISYSAEKIFSNGAKYNGELKNDLPHGKGKIIFSDGSQYEGEWKEGTRIDWL